MNHLKFWAIATAALTGLLLSPSPATAYCRADLTNQLNTLAERPSLKKARLGILIETQSGQVIYSRDAERYFVPASNVKLLTTAAALSSLGPNFTVRTSVYSQQQNGVTTLQVVGRGDPTLADSQLNELASQLKAQDINTVSSLLGNDSHFAGPIVNPNWEWEDVQAGYGAPTNSLIINTNELGLTLYPQAVGQPLRIEWDDPSLNRQWQIENFSRSVAAGQPEYVDIGRDLSRPILRVYGQLISGAAPDKASVAVPNPADYFISRFRQTLGRQGITVAQTGLTTVNPSGSELAAVTSPPLAQWLVRTNRNSKNIYAEAILKSLGGPNAEDATAAGVRRWKPSSNGLGSIQTSMKLWMAPVYHAITWLPPMPLWILSKPWLALPMRSPIAAPLPWPVPAAPSATVSGVFALSAKPEPLATMPHCRGILTRPTIVRW